jgi:DNA primase small subunit
MNDISIRTAEGYFRAYYETNGTFGIRDIPKREMAFSLFGRGGMIRHTSFKNFEELREYVLKNPPQHFYYSSAYYGMPDAEMENKIWLGADLVFDIDGDHIEGADRMSYSEMLLKVKEELRKLLVILKDDLDVKDENIEIVFSGSRGYHAHVYSIFEALESQERREIVDYITGKCLSPEYTLFGRTKWEQRIELIRESLLKISKTGGRKWKEKLAEETGVHDQIPDKKDKKFNEYIDSMSRKLAMERFASKIDEPVTIDVHRLIRTPGSLHGKSGLMVKIIDPSSLENFDPLSECIPKVFMDETEVNVLKGTEVEFFGEKRKLSEGRQKIPVYSALFTVLRGNAEFVG